jgi:peptidyl-prolyl cis-trans isomerase A (cyclophilin A)
MKFNTKLTRRLVCSFAMCLGLFTIQVSQAQDTAKIATAPQVKFVTNMGEFVAEVYLDKAPKTAENFLQYVRDKHYDGTIFHRVIANFMIQGGGYDARYIERPTRAPVMHEGLEALSKGGPRNTVGTLAMARTNAPHSATSQFFINVVDNGFLDPNPQQPGYTVFGKVVSGMDVVNRIRAIPTSFGGPFPTDVPRTQVVIKSATVLP